MVGTPPDAFASGCFAHPTGSIHNTVIATCRALCRPQLASRACCGILPRINCTFARGIIMTPVVLTRRNFLAGGGVVLASGASGLLLPARAEGLAPTDSMAGGANNYRKGAAIVDRIGKG